MQTFPYVLGFLSMAASAVAQGPASDPLAYVRTLAIAPVSITVAKQPPLSKAPPLVAIQDWKRWRRDWLERTHIDSLQQNAIVTLDSLIGEQVRTITGIVPLPSDWPDSQSAWSRQGTRALPTVSSAAMNQVAIRAEASASLAVAIDFCSVRQQLDRAMEVRLVAFIQPLGEAPRGPYVATGWARASRTLKGFSMDDDALSKEACSRAVRALIHTLRTGVEAPFARGKGIAVIPTFLAAEPLLQMEGRDSEKQVVPSLLRQLHVFLQPELPPFATLLTRRNVEQGQLKFPIQVVWPAGSAMSVAALKPLAESLSVEFLFLSRIESLVLEEESLIPVADADRKGTRRKGIAKVRGALVQPSTGAVLWSDEGEAALRVESEFVRGREVMLTRDQCFVDAARAAFGSLRRSFDQYLQQFVR